MSRQTLGKQFLRLRLADHLDLRSLSTAEGNLIADYLIFDRIPERGVKYHLDLVASHKTHLDYSLTETTVTVNLHDHGTLTRLQFGKPHKKLCYLNGIYAGELLSRSKAVDPVLVPVVTLISYTVTSSVPRLDTDERSDLSRR